MTRETANRGAPDWGALRSYLFVPGNRPDRFAKAAQSGADAVIVDLEDAVAPGAKTDAREAVAGYLSDSERREGNPALIVRINALNSADGLRDLLMLQDLGAQQPAAVLIPKARCAEDMQLVDSVLSGSDMAIGALIESCEGLDNAGAIARATPRLKLMMFGGADMALDLRVALAWDPLLSARAAVVQAAARAGVVALDMPWVDLSDEAGYRAELSRSFALGFTARAAIHPAQIAAIHNALTPQQDAVAQAEQVMQVWRESSGGVATWNGKLIEKPLVAQSQRILDLARVAKG